VRTRAARARAGRRPPRPVGPASRQLVLALASAAVLWWSMAVACGASNWVTALSSGSKGESQAKTLPSAPGSVAASCAAPTTAKTIKVTWSAVTLATSYSIYDATSSANGSYSLMASGVTGTSWTSSTLTSGTNYWFKVTAVIGSNWASAQSTASGESTINSVTPFCVQP
jgi:hypothetical protein